jgi:hypothetical protein
VLLAVVPCETVVTVAASLALLLSRLGGFEMTGDAPVLRGAIAITGEIEPLIQTIPEPMLDPPGRLPDPDVPERMAG